MRREPPKRFLATTSPEPCRHRRLGAVGQQGAPAVERVAAVGADDLDTAAREGVGGDAVVHVAGSDRRHRDLLGRTGLLCRVQQAGQELGSWSAPYRAAWPTGCGRSSAASPGRPGTTSWCWLLEPC